MNNGIFAVFFCAIALALAISYLESGLNPGSIATNVVIYLLAFALIRHIYAKQKEETESNVLLSELMKALSRISYYRSANLPLINSLKKSAASSNGKASIILSETANRMSYGESFANSITGAIHDQNFAAKLGKYLVSGESGISGSVMMYESKRKAGISRSNALASRYATCSMFVSTVAPSFIIFSFIGSLLISQSSSSIAFLAIALTAAIPLVYSVLNSMSTRRFVE